MYFILILFFFKKKRTQGTLSWADKGNGPLPHPPQVADLMGMAPSPSPPPERWGWFGQLSHSHTLSASSCPLLTTGPVLLCCLAEEQGPLYPECCSWKEWRSALSCFRQWEEREYWRQFSHPHSLGAASPTALSTGLAPFCVPREVQGLRSLLLSWWGTGASLPLCVPEAAE